jgi:fucose 4-O-acetylase-like acetyltransferase
LTEKWYICAAKCHILAMRTLNRYASDEEGVLATFSFLRFPLIVMVVICHAYIYKLPANHSVEGFAALSFVLSKIVARIAVPNFLFISGYLLFRGVENPSLRLYCEKLKRRLRTLVIPYIFWNLAIILLYFMGQTLVPDLFSGGNARVCDYTPLEWLQAFWRVDGTDSPINPPLWYMRNLMVLVVLSPVVYLLLKNRVVGALFLVTMLGLWLGVPKCGEVVWLQPKVVFFFSLGAWFSIHRVAFPKFRLSATAVLLFLYIAAIVGTLSTVGEWQRFVYEVAILLGMPLSLYVAHYLVTVKGWQVPSLLSSSYFFIYLYHYIPQALVQRVMLRVLSPATNGGYLVIYIFSVVVTLFAGVLLFHLIKRFLPKTTAFILGNR